MTAWPNPDRIRSPRRRRLRWWRVLAVAVPLLGAGALVHELAMDRRVAAGFVELAREVPGRDEVLVRARVPGARARYVVCEGGATEELWQGTWIFARGEADEVGEHLVLRAQEVASAPVAARVTRSPAWSLARRALDGASGWGIYAAVAGGALLLFATHISRALAGFLVGAVAAAVAWHAAHLGDWSGLWRLGNATASGSALLAFALGVAVGVRRDGLFAALARRGAAALAGWAAAPLAASLTGAPPDWMAWFLPAIACLSPTVMLALCASWLVSLYVDAQPAGTSLIAAVCLFALHFATRGECWPWRELAGKGARS